MPRFRSRVVSSHPNYLICADGSLVRVVDGIGEGTPAQVAELTALGLALEVIPEPEPASSQPAPKRARKAASA